jgi:5-methylcytosine-specific restriction endonuclease McrA
MTKEWQETRRRQRAFAACGHYDWVKCKYCKTWGPRDGVVSADGGRNYVQWFHPKCHAAYIRARRRIPEVGEQARLRDRKRGSGRPNRAESVKKDNASPKKKERSKRYYMKGGKEIVLDNWRRRRARLEGAIGSHTREAWEALLYFHNWSCARCGRNDQPLTEDHVVPLTRGGDDFITNIQPLCRPCNARKGNREAA